MACRCKKLELIVSTKEKIIGNIDYDDKIEGSHVDFYNCTQCDKIFYQKIRWVRTKPRYYCGLDEPITSVTLPVRYKGKLSKDLIKKYAAEYESDLPADEIIDRELKQEYMKGYDKWKKNKIT